MAWTTPRTWVSGELVTAAMMNAHVRDNMNALGEEGTWTPVLTGQTSGSGQTYTTQLGLYARSHNAVHFWFTIVLSAKGTITGSTIISGLPYAARNLSGMYNGGMITLWDNMATSYASMSLYLQYNTTYMIIRTAAAGGGTSTGTITQSDLNNTSGLIGQGTYLV
jgi:hypothetical protein